MIHLVMSVQVTPGENAVLVVLLSTVTALAVHDLLGTMSRKPVKVTKKKMFPDKADWGTYVFLQYLSTQLT